MPLERRALAEFYTQQCDYVYINFNMKPYQIQEKRISLRCILV
jgi:hypothetical protein